MSDEEGEEYEPTFWEIYKDEVGEIIKSVPDWVKYWQTEETRLRRETVLIFCVLLGMVIGIVGYLSSQRIVSGESMTFLAGAVVGYIFAFLQKYLRIG